MTAGAVMRTVESVPSPNLSQVEVERGSEDALVNYQFQ
jgi:hypothetical protein